MSKLISLALVVALLMSLVVLPAGATGLGLGAKAVFYPLERLSLDEAFAHLRMSEFLGVEGLTAILEGGIGFSLRTVSLDIKLLLTQFDLDGAVVTPFTGGGLTLELSQGVTYLIPEGLAGIEYSLSPLLLLIELRVQSLRGMAGLLGVGWEF
jgi:hypothetical protein